jgi:hypothetical protein
LVQRDFFDLECADCGCLKRDPPQPALPPATHSLLDWADLFMSSGEQVAGSNDGDAGCASAANRHDAASVRPQRSLQALYCTWRP